MHILLRTYPKENPILISTQKIVIAVMNDDVGYTTITLEQFISIKDGEQSITELQKVDVWESPEDIQTLIKEIYNL